MPGHVGGEAFEDGADGGDGGFVAGQEYALGEARTPFDTAVGTGRGALGCAVVGADDGQGVAGLGCFGPVGGGSTVAGVVEVHDEVDVDLGVDGVETLRAHGVGAHVTTDGRVHGQPFLVPTGFFHLERRQRDLLAGGVEGRDHQLHAEVQSVPCNAEVSQ
ncbi:hypothetical protein D3C73_1338840 [compost metagenome]